MRTSTNDLFADIGYMSVNHDGEQLCGDHVDTVYQEGENSNVIVLADGLGSGVKASILSTLTAKIISTMLASGLPIEDCVETIAATLPVCAERHVAYCTFTIIRIINNEKAEIIQYDNPKTIFIRDGKNCELPVTVKEIGGKKICFSETLLKNDDVFIAMSDGVEHAGAGGHYNFNWKRENIIEYMENFMHVGFTAKTLSTILIDEVNNLYDGRPEDDATACVVHIRQRVPVNLIFGPPEDPDDSHKMMSLFFAKKGKHIVSGGTTAKIAAEYLGKEVYPCNLNADPTLPPMSEIEGVDLVTEGVVTMDRVLKYAKDYLEDNRTYDRWNNSRDGASAISRALFEEGTDICFFVGCAINPAHQNPDLSISFNIKKSIVEQLTDCLEQMGKRVKVIYF